MVRKATAWLLSVGLLLGLLPVPAVAANKDGYIGNIEPPDRGAIEISTAEELNDIRNGLSGCYVLVNDIDLSDYTDWSPIGMTTNSAFRGTLDGQGHKITGLKVSEVFTSATIVAPNYAVGLFGVCDGATIKNLTLEGVDVSVVTTSGYGYISSPLGSRNTIFAGGLAGLLTGDCQVYNCCTSGTILAKAYGEGYSDALSGGIAGYVDDSTLLFCGSACSVEAYNNNALLAQDSMAGGLVGALCGSSVIDRSYNSGAVQALTGSYGDAYSGGLIGYSQVTTGRVSNSFNEGAVTAMSAAFSGGFFCDDAYAGGIAGCYAGLIDKAYNSGTVHAQGNDPYGIEDEAAYAGGICGSAAEAAVLSNCASVQPSVSASAGKKQYCRIACGGTKSNNATVSQVTSGTQNDADMVVSTEEAKAQNLYADTLGWDFTSTWEMASGKDYPQLKQNTSGAEGGDNYFQWTLEDGLLVISGSGPMPDWKAPEEVPWYDRAEEITQVRIADGITTVGGYAFFACRNLAQVTVGKGVTYISHSAFCLCEKLERLELPAALTEVGVCAFAHSGLTGVVFQGAAPEIKTGAWDNVAATVGYYSNRGGWEDVAGRDYGGALTWTDLYQQENGLLQVSEVKLSYGYTEDSNFPDKSLPGVPSANVSQYAGELFQWAKQYGCEQILTEDVCEEIVRDYMPTVVYAEGGTALVDEQYRTWEIMRDVLMINSTKDSINRWENTYLKNTSAVNLMDAQKKLSQIISEYTLYTEETQRSPLANAVYNIYALPLVQSAGKQVWKITKKAVLGDLKSNLVNGDFHAIAEDALSIQTAWKEDGLDAIIGTGQVASQDALEAIKNKFPKEFAKDQIKTLFKSISRLDPTLSDLYDAAEEMGSFVNSFKTYSTVAAYAPGIFIQLELLKLGKEILDTMEEAKNAQYFMIQYDTLRNHGQDYDAIITTEGVPVDAITLALLEANGTITLTNAQRELLNMWYSKGGEQLVSEEQRITLTSMASTAVSLQNMTPAAMQEKIVTYWAEKVGNGGGSTEAVYQVQYTLDAQSSFQVMDGDGREVGAYTPDGGYTASSAAVPEARSWAQTDLVYVSTDEAGEYVIVLVRDPEYSIQVEASSFMLVDALTEENTSYSAYYEGLRGQTVFGLQDREILARGAGGEVVPPAARYAEDESIASLDAEGLYIQYQGSDSAERVTGDLTLPRTGDLGSSITWRSSNQAVVDSTGAVTRGETDQTVLLTAVASRGEFQAEKTFSVVVAGKKILVTLLDGESGDQLGQIETTAGSRLTEEMVSAQLPEGLKYTGCFYDAEQKYPCCENQTLDRSVTLYVKTDEASEWSGSLGDGLTWSLDAGYHLSISGTGPMPDSVQAPWEEQREKIRSVHIEDGVTSVSAGLLTDLPCMTQIVVADSVTRIDPGAFAGCTALETLQLPFAGVSRDAAGEDGILGILFGRVSSGGTVQYYGTDGSQLSGYRYGIPDTLRQVVLTDASRLSFGAFCGCAMLTEVKVNDGITAVGTYAFFGCAGLAQLEIPASVTEMDADCLKECPQLTVSCYSGTAAHTFCEDNGIPYRLLDDETPFNTVTVAGGTGTGSYRAGDLVAIGADPPAFGQRFKQWDGADGLEFVRGGANGAESTFVMPAAAVELTAVYENLLTIWLDAETLSYRTSLPEDMEAVLIVAGYDSQGRMLGAAVREHVDGTGTLDLWKADYYKAFLLGQGALLPQCAGWDSRQAA